jgi:hypothetical protein
MGKWVIGVSATRVSKGRMHSLHPLRLKASPGGAMMIQVIVSNEWDRVSARDAPTHKWTRQPRIQLKRLDWESNHHGTEVVTKRGLSS